MTEDDTLRLSDDTVDIKLNDYQRSNLLFLLLLVTCDVGPFRRLHTGEWASDVIRLLDETDVLAFPQLLKSFPELLKELKEDGCKVSPQKAQAFQKTLQELLERHNKTAQRLGYPHAQELTEAQYLELEKSLKELEEQDPEIKAAAEKVSERLQDLYQQAMDRFQESLVENKLQLIRHSLPFVENPQEKRRRLAVIQEVYRVKNDFQAAGEHFSLGFIDQGVEAIINGDWEELKQIEDLYNYSDETDPGILQYREKHAVFRTLFQSARLEPLSSHSEDLRVLPGGKAGIPNVECSKCEAQVPGDAEHCHECGAKQPLCGNCSRVFELCTCNR